MMSIVGMASVPILALSLVFIYYHSKFIRLYNAYNNHKQSLHELKLHKLELLLFFSQDLPLGQSSMSKNLEELEQALCGYDFSDDDKTELSDISIEIEDAQNMYDTSKEEFEKFTGKFPGKQLLTYLGGK